ncbi:MAG TPA: phage tail sheath C-terminal domain-containing protein [Trueperaceae bacterium]|nr:phage tail sheath C-terminal domain-containing protein [Trueperaceae bacterium]
MATTYRAPGVFVEEVQGGTRPIMAVGTSTTGFVGVAPKADAPRGEAIEITNWSNFVQYFVADDADDVPPDVVSTHLSHAVNGFFLNGGRRCYVVAIGGEDGISDALDVMAKIDDIAIVAAPGYIGTAAYEALRAHCETLGDRVAIVDPPEGVEHLRSLVTVGIEDAAPRRGRAAAGEGETSDSGEVPGVRPPDSSFLALYFPWLRIADPLAPRGGARNLVNVPPSGHLAGIWSRTDATRGVHKAPANEPVRGALGLVRLIGRAEQEELNSRGVNCIRYFTREGILVWGARTLAAESSEYRYLSVRRLVNMIKESIANDTRWVVFEPNDYTLWKSIERDCSAFLTLLWRDGALIGQKPEDAFFVKCDEETNPPPVRDAGRVVTEIGIAPVRPAEFVIFRIGQKTASTPTSNRGGS